MRRGTEFADVVFEDGVDDVAAIDAPIVSQHFLRKRPQRSDQTRNSKIKF